MRELQQRFKKCFNLGKGGFGNVYKVIDLRNDEYGQESEELAIKAQNLLRQEDVYAATKEFNITKRVTFHKIESLIRLRYGILISNISIENYAGQQKEFNLIYFVMELGQTTLKQELKIKKIQFKPQELHDLMYSLCKGLNQLHNNAQIIHMDISLDNIIKTKDQKYKISDLGAALVQRNELSQTVSKHFQFKEQYLSPQIKAQIEKVFALMKKKQNFQENISEIKKNTQLLKQNDCYALGLVFYMVVTFNLKKIKDGLKYYEELEERRKEMILELNKYKNSSKQQQQDLFQQYPDYLIESIQNLLDYTEITDVFEAIEQKEQINQLQK
ncbi:hypothetical protein ABPG72_021567 [Tetrahymena utriculariae]